MIQNVSLHYETLSSGRPYVDRDPGRRYRSLSSRFLALGYLVGPLRGDRIMSEGTRMRSFNEPLTIGVHGGVKNHKQAATVS